MSSLADAFHEFERSGWQRAAEHYGDAFGGLTVQTATPLLDAAHVRAGSRVLDVATGPGFIASAAAARGAIVTGLDFSPAMIALARRRDPAIEFGEGDAERLAFEADAFDAVLMNFGLLHLAVPDAALAEAFRVLRPGGRYALTVWAAPEQAVGFGIALDAIREHGNPDVPLPEGPPFFRFSAAGAFAAELRQAGFDDVHVETVPVVWRLASADALFDALSRGGVRTAAVLRAQTPSALAAIRSAIGRSLAGYAKDGAYFVPMPAVLASATKPQG